ncbi:MAG: dephospho-CoA kinase [Polyangiales bacterium]
MQPTHQRPWVGLTGGIGAGKSTVGRMFAALGIPVVDADRIARQVVAPGGTAHAQLRAALPKAFFDAAGQLDRPALAALIFRDAAWRTRVEAILHPAIDTASTKALAAAATGTVPYVIYEAALLVEGGRHRALDALIVVDLPEHLQQARVVRRDGLSATEFAQRHLSQVHRSVRLAAADVVIDNSGVPAHAEAQVRAVHASLCQRFRDWPAHTS